MEKPLQIAFRNLDSSPHLETLIRERVDRLERFFPRLIGCRVVVELTSKSANAKSPLGISIELDVPGRPTIFAKKSDERRDAKGDFLAVVNQAFDAAQRQLEDVSRVIARDVKLHEGSGETGCVREVLPLEDYGFVEIREGESLYFTRNAVIDGRFDDIKPGMMVHVTRATTEGPMGPQASSIRLQGAPQSMP
ncbi:MAG: ribosome-associated translation inhibitor RaiA [Rhodospirillaceae bacterium]|nr:MAG: ribosome-associated translation inhibitor RaiA [Rhodospirillaceae bacterium]